MPTYQYRCTDCNNRFSVTESISAQRKPVPCPKCKSRKTQQQLSASYIKTIKKS